MGCDIFNLLMYIDDILLNGCNLVLLTRLISLLSLEFKLRDLGPIYYFLGIDVKPTSMGLLLTQHKYVIDILNKANMSFCNPIDNSISSISFKL
jgi:hypothetical protein